IIKLNALIMRGLLKGPQRDDSEINFRIRVHEPGMRKIFNIELEALTKCWLAIAFLCKNQTAAPHAVYQVAIRDNKIMRTTRMRVVHNKRRARTLTTVLEHGIHPDGIKQQFFGDGINFHK